VKALTSTTPVRNMFSKPPQLQASHFFGWGPLPQNLNPATLFLAPLFVCIFSSLFLGTTGANVSFVPVQVRSRDDVLGTTVTPFFNGVPYINGMMSLSEKETDQLQQSLQYQEQLFSSPDKITLPSALLQRHANSAFCTDSLGGLFRKYKWTKRHINSEYHWLLLLEASLHYPNVSSSQWRKRA